MAIKESLLKTIQNLSVIDYLRVVTSAGESRKVAVNDVAKTVIANYDGVEIAGKNQSVAEAIDDINSSVGDVQGDISTINSSINSITGDIDTIEGNITTISGDITTINGNISDINDDLEEVGSDISTINSDIAGLKSKARKIQSGKTEAITVASKSYADYVVYFPEKFDSAPDVVCCLDSTSKDSNIGDVTAAVTWVQETGWSFTARIFNHDSAARSPAIRWIAVL